MAGKAGPTRKGKRTPEDRKGGQDKQEEKQGMEAPPQRKTTTPHTIPREGHPHTKTHNNGDLTIDVEGAKQS